MRMTGGEAVARTLEQLGVTHVFSIVSVHNLPIYDALSRSTIEVVACRHEQFAVHAADGCARATGGLGVALVSTGPGTTNALSGVYEAQFGSSPVLLLTGQVESAYYGKGKGFLHESDRQLDLLRPVTRRAETVWRAEDAARIVADVARDCMRGRPQPCAVEIPIDQQYREAEIAAADVNPVARLEPAEADVASAAELLDAAQRPLIWAGGGVIAAGAGPELVALAERMWAPVVTTLEGRGSIPEDHLLALGPRTDRRAIGELIEQADVMLAVGTRFQNYATRMWKLDIPGRIVHLDADPTVIGRNYRPDVAVVGDAKLGLAALFEAIAARDADPAVTARVRDVLDEDLEQSWKEIGPDHRDLAAAMRAALPRDGIVVRDSTVPNYLWGNRLLPILEPRTSIRPSSLAIGPGIGLAIGAAAGTGRPTVLIVGDGGLQLGLGELATLAQHQLPVVVCVFNDRGYGVLRTVQDAVMGHRFGVDLQTPDFAAVAAACGVRSQSVAGVGEFETSFTDALEQEGPTLLDIDLSSLAPLEFPLPAHQRRR
jgi:acetolactate synthase I/II/III large subunit